MGKTFEMRENQHLLENGKAITLGVISNEGKGPFQGEYIVKCEYDINTKEGKAVFDLVNRASPRKLVQAGSVNELNPMGIQGVNKEGLFTVKFKTQFAPKLLNSDMTIMEDGQAPFLKLKEDDSATLSIIINEVEGKNKITGKEVTYLNLKAVRYDKIVQTSDKEVQDAASAAEEKLIRTKS
jgi:hypothetical protein